MERIEDIEAASANLPSDEYSRFAERFHVRDQERWDEQMDRDNASGKLDFLFREAERESMDLTKKFGGNLRMSEEFKARLLKIGLRQVKPTLLLLVQQPESPRHIRASVTTFFAGTKPLTAV